MTRTEAKAWQARLFPGDDRAGNGLTLPEICAGLRMALNGSADPWPDEVVREAASMLRATRDAWDRSRQDTFDAAVLLMVDHAIRTAEDALPKPVAAYTHDIAQEAGALVERLRQVDGTRHDCAVILLVREFDRLARREAKA
jgi:hypothetical protein